MGFLIGLVFLGVAVFVAYGVAEVTGIPPIIVGLGICFTLTLLDTMLFFFPRSLLGVIGYLGADYHFNNVAKGIIDSRDILYFLSIVFLGLYGSHLVMQEKG